MPKYVIERELPGAGKLTLQELTAISQSRAEYSDSWVARSSGYRVTSPMTTSTAFTSHPMKKWCANTRGGAGFRRTAWPKCER